MSFYGCPTSGMIYDHLGRTICQIPEHLREEFRRSASQHGITLLETGESPQEKSADPAPAPKAP